MYTFYQLFFPMTRWPFDWRSPAGYIVAWICGNFGLASVIFGFVPFSNYLLGSCWLFIFIADDIAEDLNEFNIVVSTETGTFDGTKRIFWNYAYLYRCDAVSVPEIAIK